MTTEQQNKRNKPAPFSDNPIMIGYDCRLFNFNDDIGYTFPKKRIIHNGRFVDVNERILALKNREDKFLVLNLGDSSTSGWDSNKVFKGCHNPLAALFSYKTYSDLLQEKYGVETINAGVPGYTTYQAKKYLPALLKKLAKNQVYVDYVTIYLGNNDCTFNGLEDKVRIDFKTTSKEETLTRVSKDDFIENFKEIIRTVMSYGAGLIILLPASNLQWWPGFRSIAHPEELEVQLLKLTNTKVKELFQESQRAYQKLDFEQALEKDLLLPRMKKEYKSALTLLASKNNLTLIDTQNYVADADQFLDYCHPDESLNNSIADSINKHLKKKNNSYKDDKDQIALPLDTYTLY